MNTTTLRIKNMVCPRCIMAVEDIINELGWDIIKIDLGEVIVAKNKNGINWEELKEKLEKIGFELLEDIKIQLVEKIKSLIVQHIHHSEDEELKINYSDYLATEIGKDYRYLSNLFSDIENVTIERFIILQKIERVKEQIIYDELTLSEIAYKLNYSSVAHLSNQFKQVTGFTPTRFKKLKSHKRKTIDEISNIKFVRKTEPWK